MKLMLYIKILLFGQRAQGQPVPQPTFKTTTPIKKPTQEEWVKHVKFGSRYGTRGSFYQN
jgi:hypothetical protein